MVIYERRQRKPACRPERLCALLTAVRNFIITFLLSLLIFGLFAYGLLEFATSAFRVSDDNESETESPDVSGSDIIDDPVQDASGESFTALLLGTDYLPDVYHDYDVSDENETADPFPLEPRTVETDTILLVRVNKETGECLFSAIPAITQIKIDGHLAKLKDLYAAKGIDALCTQIMAMTGLPIDYYAVISIDNMIKLIDRFDGITYTVPTDMHYFDENAGLNINLRAGSQHLDGKKSLDMLRYWLYADEDTSRRQCAIDFLKAFITKVFSQIDAKDAAIYYPELRELFDETNFTIKNLADNVELIFAYNKLTVFDYTYPGTTTGKGSSAIFTPNITKALDELSKYKFKG